LITLNKNANQKITNDCWRQVFFYTAVAIPCAKFCRFSSHKNTCAEKSHLLKQGQRYVRCKPLLITMYAFSNENKDAFGGENEMETLGDDEMLIIFRGSEDVEIYDALWEDIETGQPPQWMVIKEVRERPLLE
jgi:hypothetical protein